MKPFILILSFCSLFILTPQNARANDGRFFTEGNQLLPILETDICLNREVLTITLTDNGWAEVDVIYTLFNPSNEKNICVGFEAPIPGGAVSSEYNPLGIHPYIKDFIVEVNNATTPFKNAVTSAWSKNKRTTFQQLDTTEWKIQDDEVGTLYNIKIDSCIEYSYTYYFQAQFKPGINTLHHHYRYLMSESVGYAFGLDYRLSPAIRWANHQIDDFSLIIRCPNTAKHFTVNDFGIKSDTLFQVIEGVGKTRRRSICTGDSKCEITEISLRNGAIRYHCVNFCPNTELEIVSGDNCALYQYDQDGNYVDRTVPFGFFYDRGPTQQLILKQEGCTKRIQRNLPYAHRGYVFKDKKLQQYFDKLWWYMPDATYKPTNKDFTPYEKERLSKKSNKL